LSETDPPLHAFYREALRSAAAGSAFLRHGGRFPLAARGDINTYAVFTELAATTINPKGRAGLILPIGIATDDTTKLLFGSLVQKGQLRSVGFENEDHIFGRSPRDILQNHHYGLRTNETKPHRVFGASRNWPKNMIFSNRVISQPEHRYPPGLRTKADAELTKAPSTRAHSVARRKGNEPEITQPAVVQRMSTCQRLHHLHGRRVDSKLLLEGKFRGQ
jgi:hypothetical protein